MGEGKDPAKLIAFILPPLRQDDPPQHPLQVLADRVAKSQMTVAMHFLKHNDQRRLEPIRIVKSLAFQLAWR